jgi:hypothetical protein
VAVLMPGRLRREEVMNGGTLPRRLQPAPYDHSPSPGISMERSQDPLRRHGGSDQESARCQKGKTRVSTSSSGWQCVAAEIGSIGIMAFDGPWDIVGRD